jgi:hypothetical protein
VNLMGNCAATGRWRKSAAGLPRRQCPPVAGRDPKQPSKASFRMITYVRFFKTTFTAVKKTKANGCLQNLSLTLLDQEAKKTVRKKNGPHTTQVLSTATHLMLSNSVLFPHNFNCTAAIEWRMAVAAFCGRQHRCYRARQKQVKNERFP